MHLWWWAEDAQPPQARRARIDRLLRATLAAYLDVPASELAFGREDRGRPFLRHADAPDFNLTDTRGGTLVAVCRGGRVGVDIERHDRRLPMRALARRWFAPSEADALDALPEDEARLAFLCLWTAKEASCKATGTGIFDQRLQAWQFDPGSVRPLPRALPPEAGAAAEWRFLRVAPSPAHTVVVACRGAVARTAYIAVG
ncbi:4'-phosphopantetheinyl transferase superfamily protein [Coralloluteibacterium stylophorae]|uniref:4'-phosphopantetheinyl transferase superfamily protein n=2 Tax=Coralloluteibacterium stylophorae TaxID=1776034 RepID=A0A8J7VSA4_9GAMM|nr:4'-phosphopantetheinyl transferase superfamily protein [Coralloluteibacterium stylophorae]